jgi:hypothetical protein
VRRDADIIGYMYNDTEQKIREQIAKEIEANCGLAYSCAFTDCTCNKAAAIARGKK